MRLRIEYDTDIETYWLEDQDNFNGPSFQKRTSQGAFDEAQNQYPGQPIEVNINPHNINFALNTK